MSEDFSGLKIASTQYKEFFVDSSSQEIKRLFSRLTRCEGLLKFLATEHIPS